MNILIDNLSGVPIYDQIFSQIKAQIISGALHEDEALPSIRNLAKDLRVSVITTKRAYDELEREGFLYTVAGKGCFVARSNPEQLREENLRQIEARLAEAARLAKSCGIGRGELIQMLEYLTEEET
ncbi:MAG: GntR family transcriptional regulator [Ruminococcaceae bacterium]|nr:GntR family transcriptional regulator [Oscillospiraceae bacterium]